VTDQKTVLIAEDDRDSAEMLQEMLTMQGYRVEVVGVARATIGAIASKRFDAVILDLTMPGMSTDELVTEIMRLERSSPLVVFSARPEFEVAMMASRLNAEAVLKKPVDMDELLQTLSRVVHSSRGDTI
jgi:two-component system phosphate regulon response regulator OmpR